MKSYGYTNYENNIMFIFITQKLRERLFLSNNTNIKFKTTQYNITTA